MTLIGHETNSHIAAIGFSNLQILLAIDKRELLSGTFILHMLQEIYLYRT